MTGGCLVLDDADHIRQDAAAGSVGNLEGSRLELAAQPHRALHMIRVDETGHFHHQFAPLGHQRTPGDHLIDGHILDVADDQNVREAPGCDLADVPGHPKMLGSVQGRHLESDHGVGALLDGVTDNPVHMAFSDQGP